MTVKVHGISKKFEALNAKCKWKRFGFFCSILENRKGEIFPFAWDNSIVLLEGPEWLYISLMCQDA